MSNAHNKYEIMRTLVNCGLLSYEYMSNCYRYYLDAIKVNMINNNNKVS